MFEDKKIEVDREKAKQIAQVITKEIKDSFASNKAIYDRAKRNENISNQISKWMEDGKICDVPWKGAADYFIPMIEWIIDAIYARLLSILFSQEPYMKASGRDSASYGNQDNATEFVDKIFREKVKLYENTNFFFKQLLKLPFAVLKYEWYQEYDSQITKEQAIAYIHPETQDTQLILPEDPQGMMQAQDLTAQGYEQAGPQESFVLNDVEIYNAPRIQYIRFSDYAWAPNTKRGAKPYWEGDRCWFTVNDLTLKVRQEKFIPESVDAVKTAAGTGAGIENIVAQREKPIECFHWYGRLPFNQNNEIDFSSSETIEQEVYACVALKDDELLELTHWQYSRYPKEERVYIRESFEDSDNFEGRSMVDKLYKTQQELNDLHNTIQNNAWLAMQKIFAKRKTLAGDTYDNPKVFPGAMWEEDQPGDIRVLEVGDVKAIGMNLEQTLLQFAERISNISNWNLGARNDQRKPTATEFAGVIREGNIGREPLLQRCYKLLAKLCEWTIDYYDGRIEPGMERTITDETGNTIYPSSENMKMFNEKGISPAWDNEQLKGNFSWAWSGTSLNSDRQYNMMVDNDLMNLYMVHPMVAGNMLATWTILKKGLIDRGVKNWNEILPPREAIVKEMQRMELQSQIKKKLMANAPVMPGQPAIPGGNLNARPIPA